MTIHHLLMNREISTEDLLCLLGKTDNLFLSENSLTFFSRALVAAQKRNAIREKLNKFISTLANTLNGT